MQKLYCYVDETGQDTHGGFFIVAVVILGQERDILRTVLSQIELSSRKGKKKWMKSTIRQKLGYIEQVINTREFQGKVFYVYHTNTIQYLDCVLSTVKEAIDYQAYKDYRLTLLIDGLRKEERQKVGTRLRMRQIRTEKVRGLRDESDEFIRLADSMAGFIRDYLEEKDYTLGLYQKAVSRKVIQEIGRLK